MYVNVVTYLKLQICLLYTNAQTNFPKSAQCQFCFSWVSLLQISAALFKTKAYFISFTAESQYNTCCRNRILQRKENVQTVLSLGRCCCFVKDSVWLKSTIFYQQCGGWITDLRHNRIEMRWKCRETLSAQRERWSIKDPARKD